jgi:EmrB/QacA subfamily drug resistance transporter
MPPHVSSSIVKKYLPWVVATALFMEQLDSTIVNTAVPAMAENLHVTPLSLKAVSASYIISLAVCIPVSGWMADRYGTRRVFSAAIAIFTLSSMLCGLAVNVPMLILARLIQGIGGAMMMPVGRLTIIRAFPKSELLVAMNFVIIPALIGPLLGPTVGGLIVHWLSWREIFFVNLPIGLAAQYIIYRYMPNYHGEAPYPLDVTGFALFGAGTAILSWLLEVFGEHDIASLDITLMLLLAVALLASYVRHAAHMRHPLLNLSLLKARTFRASVTGGFITRLGIGGMPFLQPLLYQIGLGFMAWQSGLLMMPSALAAMTMKVLSSRLLKKFGFRGVLVYNTFLMGATIGLYALVTPATPIVLLVALGLIQGFTNSLQFSAINSMVYADIEPEDSSMASALASSLQQMALSFGLAGGSLIAGWFLGGHPQSDHTAVISALHGAFLTLGILTMFSSLFFRLLHPRDGESVSRANLQELSNKAH